MTEAIINNWTSTLSLNQWIIDMQLKDISHEDSMINPPFRANRLNWVVGHLAEHRDWMLRAVDETTLMPANQVELYRRGSAEMQADDEVVALETLVDYLARSKQCLLDRLGTASSDFLAEIPQTGILMESHKDKTRLERLQGLLWHETYHVGQLEFLRQLAGKNDAVLR
ncbi:MAG: DinB family protein [Chloroflexota bacterium]